MKTREFFRKSQFPLMLALGTYPLVEILLMFGLPEWMIYGWLFSAAYATLAIIMLALPGKLRIVFSMLSAALMLVPFNLFPMGRSRDALMVIGIVYAALLIWNLSIPGWETHKEMPAGWISTCVVIELLGCFFATYGEEFRQVAWAIRGSFVGLVLLVMLSMNRGSLNLAAGDNWKFVAPMRWKNVLLTLGMFAIALGFAAIPHVFDLLIAGFKWIGRTIDMLQAMLDRPVETTEQLIEETTFIRSTEENWRDVLLEGVETKRTSEQMFALITAIALVVIVPLMCVAVYKLSKWLVKKVYGLIVFIEQSANIQQEDFVDEITDTREENQHERREKAKQRKQTLWLRNMTPAEKIRYRYRRLRVKHPEWKDNETVRENLPKEVAELYERARYSDHPVTHGDAERFRNQTKYGYFESDS